MACRLALGSLLVCGMVLGSGPTQAQAPAAQPQPEKMVTYQLVFVRESDRDEPLSEHQTDRVATVQQLYEEQLVFDGASLISGTLDGAGEIKSVAVLDVETTKAAEAVFQHNPAMELGMIELDVYSWSTMPGVFQKPARERERTTCYLGLLKRPTGAPSYSTEELAKIQEGHMANIGKMHQTGDLAAAGPVDNAGDLRGILIFRTTDRQRIEKLVAEDPAIKAGRLRLELYRWNVPKGVLP